ncbi:MAG: DUF1549 domain-containing protein [Chthoniobacteraceae bacterium]
MLSRFVLVALLPAAALANAEGDAFFRQKIEPILRENCFKCHSHADGKMKGNLVVDSRDALIAGGDTGPAVVPGAPAKSLLIEAIGYKNVDLQMPPKGKRLTDEQVATLTDWVKQGAPWPEEPGHKMKSRPRGTITEEDRKWWAFQPVAKVEPPPADPWCANDIDRFIFARLKAEGLAPAPRAEKGALIRRVYFDLVGLPPTPEEVSAFLTDKSPGSYAKLVDRLLASPRYGERWARHWLDVVRYAESDGYRLDEYRPHAWRYRDYVIRSFNADKPYDRFVQEQLAGDELWPDDPDARIATGYLAAGIYEYNNRDAVGQWSNMLNDLTDTTADVFLGMGVQCARCHDHKFDPILQKDYFRLQAFFAPIRLQQEGEVASLAERADYARKLAVWEEKSADLRRQIAELEAPYRDKAARDAIEKFPIETRALIAKPVSERTPYEQQIVELAWRQVDYEWSYKRFEARVKEPAKSARTALLIELKKFDTDKPEPLPVAPTATDVGPKASPIFVPKKAALGEIAPGVLTILDEGPAKIEPCATTTGRRAALARWLTQPENPLTARVIVNRVWQYHFGRGLAINASDFGKLGEKPSHPELLDWLAHRFVEEGWSMKKLHRSIVTSAAYTQSATNPAAAQARVKDPENILLWRASTKRLDAEQIRDAILSVTGEIKLPDGGPAADFTKPVRTVFNEVKRNVRDPVLEVFDLPEGFSSISQRNTTTTPTQSLLMINSRWALERARAFALWLRSQNSSDEGDIVAGAYRRAFGRDPRGTELARARKFIDEQAGAIAADAPPETIAPFANDKMRYREGQSAQLMPGSTQERLVVLHEPGMPKADFTIEAFINIKSVYETGAVRTIVSKWDGSKGHPGWSLGVTGKGSRNKPQTLVLQLCGDKPWKPTDPVEPIFSGVHIDLGKPYFIAVSVNLDDATERGITFYAKDLSNDDEPLQAVQVAHVVTSGIANDSPLVFGGSPRGTGNLFDGLIDDVRLTDGALRAEQLLFNNASLGERTVGYWKFEGDAPYADATGHGNDIAAPKPAAEREDPRLLALVNFCHVLLNSNEFLYVD